MDYRAVAAGALVQGGLTAAVFGPAAPGYLIAPLGIVGGVVAGWLSRRTYRELYDAAAAAAVGAFVAVYADMAVVAATEFGVLGPAQVGLPSRPAASALFVALTLEFGIWFVVGTVAAALGAGSGYLVAWAGRDSPESLPADED